MSEFLSYLVVEFAKFLCEVYLVFGILKEFDTGEVEVLLFSYFLDGIALQLLQLITQLLYFTLDALNLLKHSWKAIKPIQSKEVQWHGLKLRS